jgi:hypothetical protein
MHHLRKSKAEKLMEGKSPEEQKAALTEAGYASEELTELGLAETPVEITGSAVTSVPTIIIPDTKPTPQRSGRINSANITGDTARVRNKHNGAVNILSADAARKLVKNNSEQFEIIE